MESANYNSRLRSLIYLDESASLFSISGSFVGRSLAEMASAAAVDSDSSVTTIKSIFYVDWLYKFGVTMDYF